MAASRSGGVMFILSTSASSGASASSPAWTGEDIKNATDKAATDVKDASQKAAADVKDAAKKTAGDAKEAYNKALDKAKAK